MLGAWPEPFGLVAIESLATGTPVIARRAGALGEIVEHGIDGFLIDDLSEAGLAVSLVGDLDRARIRERAIARFSVERMVAAYERVYLDLVEGHERRIDRGGGRGDGPIRRPSSVRSVANVPAPETAEAPSAADASDASDEADGRRVSA